MPDSLCSIVRVKLMSKGDWTTESSPTKTGNLFADTPEKMALLFVNDLALTPVPVNGLQKLLYLLKNSVRTILSTW